MGLEKEEKDEVEEELQRQVLEVTMEYDKYCRQRELQELMAAYKQEG